MALFVIASMTGNGSEPGGILAVGGLGSTLTKRCVSSSTCSAGTAPLIIEVETNGGQVTAAFNLVGTAVTLDEIACPVLQRTRGALGAGAEEHIAKLSRAP